MRLFYRLLFGGAFLLFGIIWVIPAQKTTFYCQRTPIQQPPCKLTLSRINGSKTTLIPLESLRRARVQPSITGGTYRIILMTETGEIPANRTYDSLYKSKREFIDKVNNFLENKEEEIVFAKEDYRWMFYGLGLLFFLPGIVVTFNFIPISDSED